jgi:hypothetical protein
LEKLGAEIDSFPRQKLISNSQTSLVSGRGWLLLSYQHLMEHFENLSTNPNKEAQAHTPRAESPQSFWIGKGNIYYHTTQHINFKKGECLGQSPCEYVPPNEPEIRVEFRTFLN